MDALDCRRLIHGTTGEAPIERFQRAEAGVFVDRGVPLFVTSLELVRKVQADCAIEVDSNAYSVPWRRSARPSA